jgi:ubiquinone biosynthesis protein
VFIFGRFFLWALWRKLWRKMTRQEYAHHLRLLLEHLGGMWIKLGQLLSLRTDVFSREFCQELSRLQTQAQGFPPALARQIIEEDLGGSLETYFEDFEEMPFAAASIGQVHRARLRHEGVVVAVKVQRPYAPEMLRREMTFVRVLVRIFERLWFVPNLRWQEMLWELNQILAEEIDYRFEASSTMRMRKALRRHGVYVHKVFLRYSTRRVLVTEYVTAVLMADYIRVHKSDPARCERWHEENNVDPRLVARRLFNSLWRQLLEDNLFHADLHPGNIILLRDSCLALIDFGAIGSMEREYQQRYFKMVEACNRQDFAKATDCLLMLSGALPPTDLTEVKEKIIRHLRGWTLRSYIKSLPYHEKSMSSLANELIKILFQYECAADWSFLRITRAQDTVDQTLMYLYPEANYTKLMERYFDRARERARQRVLRPREVRRFVDDLISVLRLPQQILENATFDGWILRRRAQIFRGSTSKIAQFLAVLFGRGGLIVLVMLIYFVLVFFHQHHANWVPDLAQRWLSEEIAAFPYLTYITWVLLLVIVVNLCVSLFALRRIFSVKERASQENP